MQENYRTSILSLVEQYRSFDIVAVLQARFSDQPDLSALKLGQYTGATFISLSEHLIESLEAAVRSSLWHTLPAAVQGHNEFGQVDVNNSLTAFIDLLRQKQIEQSVQNLSQLIWYAMVCGIWLDDKSQKPLSKTQLKFLASELSASSKRLSSQLDSIDKAVAELTGQRQDLVKFTEEKRNELGEIRRGLEEAKSQLNELQSILEQANSRAGEVGIVKESAQGVLNDMNVQLGVITKTYESFKTESDKQKSDLGDALGDSKDALDLSEALYQEILGYRDTIKKYVGLSVDGYLGNKFDARATRMRWGLWIWAGAIPVAVTVAIWWAVYVFQHFHTQAGVDWVTFFINLVKTSPAFILLGFVFSQYAKERNLREEYAFRGAVAMTVNTYADLLAGKDSPENSSRQSLILNALKQVHSQPKLYGERGGRLGNAKAQEIRETIATLNETLKNLKGS